MIKAYDKCRSMERGPAVRWIANLVDLARRQLALIEEENWDDLADVIEEKGLWIEKIPAGYGKKTSNPEPENRTSIVELEREYHRIESACVEKLEGELGELKGQLGLVARGRKALTGYGPALLKGHRFFNRRM